MTVDTYDVGHLKSGSGRASSDTVDGDLLIQGGNTAWRVLWPKAATYAERTFAVSALGALAPTLVSEAGVRPSEETGARH